MKDYLVKNQIKIIIVTIFALLTSLAIFSKEWIINLIWMNASVVGQRIQEQGPQKVTAILIGCLVILFILDLFWKIYTFAVYMFRSRS